METYAERIEHLLRLRALQDETAGFLTFIPLLYQLGDTRLVDRQASPLESLKMVATSRLVLDNFPHVEAYWVMLGEATASIALHFGADDMNGTLVEERIAHAAKAESPVGLAREQILRMIRDAGRVPVERDALYNVLQVDGIDGEPAAAAGRPDQLPQRRALLHAFPWPLADALPPRQLGEAVAAGRLDAGPLPLADVIRLEAEVAACPSGSRPATARRASSCSPTVPWASWAGGASRSPARPRPPSGSCASCSPSGTRSPRPALVALEEPADAVLLIGDVALQALHGAWPRPRCFDLGEEWTRWTGLPCVFAAWAVRRAVGTEPRAALAEALARVALDRAREPPRDRAGPPRRSRTARRRDRGVPARLPLPARPRGGQGDGRVPAAARPPGSLMLERIAAKLDGGERLGRDEGRFLLTDAPLLALGQLAQSVRFRLNPEPAVTFAVDTNPNYTNVCVTDCQFCAFYRKPGDREAYTLTVEEIMAKLEPAVARGATTVLLQGGHNPALPLDYYVDLVRETRRRFPAISPTSSPRPRSRRWWR